MLLLLFGFRSGPPPLLLLLVLLFVALLLVLLPLGLVGLPASLDLLAVLSLRRRLLLLRRRLLLLLRRRRLPSALLALRVIRLGCRLLPPLPLVALRRLRRRSLLLRSRLGATALLPPRLLLNFRLLLLGSRGGHDAAPLLAPRLLLLNLLRLLRLSRGRLDTPAFEAARGHLGSDLRLLLRLRGLDSPALVAPRLWLRWLSFLGLRRLPGDDLARRRSGGILAARYR